jgi:cell division protein FtsL
MTEFRTIRKIDNSRLVRRACPEHVRGMARLVGMGGVIAAVALLYAWQHFACIQLRYQLSTLKTERTHAVELNQELKLETAGLAAPARIDEIARTQLGLTVPVPGQVAPFEQPTEPVMAEMRAPGPNRTQ